MRVLSVLSGAGSAAFIFLGQQIGVTGYVFMGFMSGVVTLSISVYYDFEEK